MRVNNSVRLESPVHVWAGQTKVEAGRGNRSKERQREWHGHGRGHGSMCVVEALDKLSIASALPARVQPCGPLLREVQGQHDLAMAEGQAAKLAASTRRDSLLCSDTTVEEGLSAGVQALALWRARLGPDSPSEPSASLVCWRAVVREMSADTWGDSVELSSMSPESLAGSVLPLRRLLGDDSREDKAARLLFERTRARRPALLSRRVEAIKAQGGRGRRARAIP